MKEEMADSQWNFGDIKLPTPYQMRRYIEERKKDFRGQIDEAGRRNDLRSQMDGMGASGRGSLGSPVSTTTNTSSVTNNVEIRINGADTAKVKRIITEVVGSGTQTRTTGARRN